MGIHVDTIDRIKFFEEHICDVVSKTLPKEYRRVNVKYETYDSKFGYIFRIFYYPTGNSFADKPKQLPNGIIEKLKRKRHLINGRFYDITYFDRLINHNINITCVNIQNFKLNTIHRRKITAYITRNEVKDFFNY